MSTIYQHKILIQSYYTRINNEIANRSISVFTPEDRNIRTVFIRIVSIYRHNNIISFVREKIFEVIIFPFKSISTRAQILIIRSAITSQLCNLIFNRKKSLKGFTPYPFYAVSYKQLVNVKSECYYFL